MPRTVLVTSCTGGEGKTTISVCLGIASMTSGQKVLLVDCDFARPQVHRMLDVKNNKGLTDILKGTATLQEAIIQAAGSNLSILTVGRSPDGAIDLLNSARMERFWPSSSRSSTSSSSTRPRSGVERVDPRRPGRKDHLRDPARMDHAARGVRAVKQLQLMARTSPAWSSIARARSPATLPEPGRSARDQPVGRPGSSGA